MATASAPQPSLPQRWGPLDFGLHAFLAISPFALGLWMFSFAPLVGGNLFLAVLLAGVVVLLGAIVVGSLAQRLPVTGGDYVWQTRILGARVGAVVALTSWWLVVTMLAPIYGNVLLVQAIDPLLVYAGWNDLATWFRGEDGIFVCSLIAIAVATAFVGLGMRRAALVQRALVLVGVAALAAVLVLFLGAEPNEFRDAFDERSAEIYGTSPLASSQISQIGSFDASVAEVEPLDTFRLIPLVLLFGLWIGWAGPLAGEVRTRKPGAIRASLVRVAAAWTLMGLLFFVAIGRGNTWDLWNEANNLYWGTVYGTTPATPLAAWPNPIVFATWLTDNTFLQYAILVGMSAWLIGGMATLFLAATRVLFAAGMDDVLPRRVAKTTGDSIPLGALALLVVPACAFAALEAYWDETASWSAIGVVALAVTTAASAVAAVVALRNEQLRFAAIAALFALLVALVIGVWLLDPVYGMRTVGAVGFLAVLYAISALVYSTSRLRGRGSLATTPDVTD
jgi:basic amino acid/polyamine antiporter, APA family